MEQQLMQSQEKVLEDELPSSNFEAKGLNLCHLILKDNLHFVRKFQDALPIQPPHSQS